MSGWNGYSSGSGEREPSEESGQAAWSGGRPAPPPDWASAETRTNVTPPDWVAAQGRPGGPVPPPTGWTPPAPYPYPPPAPAPGRSGGARRLLVTLTATVVLGAGAGAAFWYVDRDGSTGNTATPATSVSTSESPQPQTSTPPASPLASVTPNSPSPSTGYRRAQDPTGYTVNVPEGWTRRQKTGQLAPVVFYDAPGDGRQLQIFRISEATPAESLELAETDPGYGFAKQPGYQVIERDRGDTWAELTYRYDDPQTGARQIVDHRFRAADGSLYAIRAGGPAGLAPERVREPLAMAVRSFCPAGAQCT
ncbi:hypothetical protein ACIQI8_21910 [Streptomyces sp. NPDC092369]|uniref:hypothetical protein n=1 Tax=Streptomyces sp. NPDC092369 TaxID=3366015 RepID=UPI00382DDEF0